MSGFRIKLLTFAVLTVCFLSYSFILYTTVAPETKPANEMAQKGKILWQQKNCTACHQQYGLGGHLGPDLTNVYKAKPEAYIRAILKTGTPVMPNFRLTDEEIDAFVEFFKYTDQTGTASPKTFKKHLDGTISQ